MANINLITTTAGRNRITTALSTSTSIQVADAQLSATNQTMGLGTTSMSAVVATLTAVGTVRAAGAGNALHIVLTDASAAAYDVRAIAIRLVGGTFLMVFSSAAIIASKASGSSLHLAFDLTIDADTAATVTFGATDYVLPTAGTSVSGIVELATSAETITGTDTTRAVTPIAFADALYDRAVVVQLTGFGTYTTPAKFRRCRILAVGGGGGGGRGYYGGGPAGGGGGGASGGIAVADIAVNSTTLAYTVGTGGAGATGTITQADSGLETNVTKDSGNWKIRAYSGGGGGCGVAGGAGPGAPGGDGNTDGACGGGGGGAGGASGNLGVPGGVGGIIAAGGANGSTSGSNAGGVGGRGGQADFNSSGTSGASCAAGIAGTSDTGTYGGGGGGGGGHVDATITTAVAGNGNAATAAKGGGAGRGYGAGGGGGAGTNEGSGANTLSAGGAGAGGCIFLFLS